MTSLLNEINETARQAGEAGGIAAASRLEDLLSEFLVRMETERQGVADQLFSIDQLAALCPALTFRQIERLVRGSELNGLASAGAVIDHNGRVFVHKGRFDEWLEGQKRKPAKKARPFGRAVVS